jgi:hypothetical protein
VHRQCPFVVFLALVDPAQVPAIEAIPECRRGAWAKSFLASHKGTLDGENAQLELLLLALVIAVDIGTIESLHATIRRIIHGRSLQTNAISLDDLDSEWLLQRHRK